MHDVPGGHCGRACDLPYRAWVPVSSPWRSRFAASWLWGEEGGKAGTDRLLLECFGCDDDDDDDDDDGRAVAHSLRVLLGRGQLMRCSLAYT